MAELLLRERAVAEVAAWTTRHNAMRRFLAGAKDDQTTWLDFYVARTRADQLPLTKFIGNPNVDKKRATWPVGILAVAGALLSRQLREHEGGRLSYAWNVKKPLGRAVLVAEIPEDHLPARGESFVSGVSVGPDDLNAALVIAMPDRTLFPLGEDQTPASAGFFELEKRYGSPDRVPPYIQRY